MSSQSKRASDVPLFRPSPATQDVLQSPVPKRARFSPTLPSSSSVNNQPKDGWSSTLGARMQRTESKPPSASAPSSADTAIDAADATDGTPDAAAHVSDGSEAAGDLPTIAALALHQGNVGASVWQGSARTLTLLPDIHAGTQTSPQHIGSVSELNEAGMDSTDPFDPSISAASPSFREADIISMVLEQYKPNVVLISSSMPDWHAKTIHSTIQSWDGELSIKPAREFNSLAGRSKLLTYHPTPRFDLQSFYMSSGSIAPKGQDGSVPERNDLCSKELEYSAIVELDKMPASCASVSALMMQAWRVAASLGAEADFNWSQGSLVAGVECMHLFSLLMVPANVRQALGVHSSMSGTSTSSHGDVTLFSFMDQTVSSSGRALLRHWLMFPSTDLELITARLDAVELLGKHKVRPDVELLRTQLKAMTNIPSLLTGSMIEGKLSLASLKKLHRFCNVGIEVHSILSSFTSQICSAIDVPSLVSVEQLLNIIDWTESAHEHHVMISWDYDEELDNLRRAFDDLPELLAVVAQRLREKVVDEFARVMQVQYFPQLGYLIALPLRDLRRWSKMNENESRETWDRSDEAEDEEGALPDIDGLRYVFTSNLEAFYKSREMEEMDLHVGDIYTAIADRQVEILQDLHDKLASQQHKLIQISLALTQLDCLISLALVARDNNYVRPKFVQENVLHIVKGRHPVAEQYLESFVPNDLDLIGGLGLEPGSPEAQMNSDPVFLSSGEPASPSASRTGNPECANDAKEKEDKKINSMIVVTGANSGGKSMYLKQNALIVYMAQCGSFVPAETAVMGVCDNILGSVMVLESSTRLQSNFTVDMTQVSFSLRQATSRSLLLLDETATATNTAEGAAIFAATVEEILLRGRETPKTIIATHYFNIFLNGILLRGIKSKDSHRVPFTPAHMEVMLPPRRHVNQEGMTFSSEGNDEVVYLFKVAQGIAGVSHAAECAGHLGIPPNIVARATYATGLLHKGESACLAWEEYDDTEDQSPLHAPKLRGNSNRTSPDYGRSACDDDGSENMEAEVQDELGPLPRDVPVPNHMSAPQRLESIVGMVASLMQADIQGLCDALPPENGIVEPGVCRGGTGEQFPVRDFVRDLVALVPPETADI